MENSIIVKKLPKDIYVPDLCEYFRCFGNILSATVHCDDQNKSSGEAYIEFDNKYSALKSVNTMNNFRLKNRTILVLLSVENSHFTQVFVKNFSPDWDELDLIKAFEHIGRIETAKISEDNGKSNGYGYVIFKNHSTAKRAVESMNGKKINGLKLIVERFKSKSERNDLMQNSLEEVEKRLQQSVQLNNLHIKNLPTNMSEDQLKELFKKCGEITSVKIAVDENGVSKGFGFVCFASNEDADKALKRFNGHTLKGKELQINFKEDGQLRRQYNILKHKEKEVRIKQYRERSKSVPKLLPRCLNYREGRGYF